VSATLAAVTFAWAHWIEIVFGVDPDHRSGALEWAIVVASITIAVSAAVLARAEFRRLQLTSYL
jgi:hypothetical protein